MGPLYTNIPPLSDVLVVWLLACHRDEGDVMPAGIAARLLEGGFIARRDDAYVLSDRGSEWLRVNGYTSRLSTVRTAGHQRVRFADFIT